MFGLLNASNKLHRPENLGDQSSLRCRYRPKGDYYRGFTEEWMAILALRNSYFWRVSDSLLLSEMKIIVLPPSRTTGYFPARDPVRSFESGILNRWLARFILFSSVSFFIFPQFCKCKIMGNCDKIRFLFGFLEFYFEYMLSDDWKMPVRALPDCLFL